MTVGEVQSVHVRGMNCSSTRHSRRALPQCGAYERDDWWRSLWLVRRGEEASLPPRQERVHMRRPTKFTRLAQFENPPAWETTR